MGLGELLREFGNDTKLHIALLLLVADLLFGVVAALKLGTFRFSYFADFLKTDVLGKVVPYFILYSLALVAGHEDGIVIPGLDFGILAGAAYGALVIAFTGSILSSLRHLGLALPDAFAGEKPPPGP